MDKLVPIIYMIGVLLLILPSFLSSNSNFKTFFTNLSIWVAIVLVVLSLYFAYNYFPRYSISFSKLTNFSNPHSKGLSFISISLP